VVPDCGHWTLSMSGYYDAKKRNGAANVTLRSANLQYTQIIVYNGVTVLKHIKYPVVPDCGHWTSSTSGYYDAKKKKGKTLVTVGSGSLW